LLGGIVRPPKHLAEANRHPASGRNDGNPQEEAA
jgi:hypothetical protein